MALLVIGFLLHVMSLLAAWAAGNEEFDRDPTRFYVGVGIATILMVCGFVSVIYGARVV